MRLKTEVQQLKRSKRSRFNKEFFEGCSDRGDFPPDILRASSSKVESLVVNQKGAGSSPVALASKIFLRGVMPGRDFPSRHSGT